MTESSYCSTSLPALHVTSQCFKILFGLWNPKLGMGYFVTHSFCQRWPFLSFCQTLTYILGSNSSWNPAQSVPLSSYNLPLYFCLLYQTGSGSDYMRTQTYSENIIGSRTCSGLGIQSELVMAHTSRHCCRTKWVLSTAPGVLAIIIITTTTTTTTTIMIFPCQFINT